MLDGGIRRRQKTKGLTAVTSGVPDQDEQRSSRPIKSEHQSELAWHLAEVYGALLGHHGSQGLYISLGVGDYQSAIRCILEHLATNV